MNRPLRYYGSIIRGGGFLLPSRKKSSRKKRLAYYEALKILKHNSIRRFAVLSGVRRVGKTTILYQIIDHLIREGTPPKNILYVTFDNTILKLVNPEKVLSVYEYVMTLFNIRNYKNNIVQAHGHNL